MGIISQESQAGQLLSKIYAEPLKKEQRKTHGLKTYIVFYRVNFIKPFYKEFIILKCYEVRKKSS